jgi:Pentapeptide repeats (8 copies)
MTLRRWRNSVAGALAGALAVLVAPGALAQTINGCDIKPNTNCPAANLAGANLSYANMPGSNLPQVNLTGATLVGANLTQSDLSRGILVGVKAQGVIMARANLRRANLQRADLRNANLRRADLLNADLTDANLQGASFCRTTMPDGSIRSDPTGCGSSLTGLAAGLVARDPGARVDGNTIVATGSNEDAFGVRHRPNFIVGLGSNETILGGAGDDQVRAFGTNVTVRAGSGNDLIYGGPRGTLIGGPGRDLLIENEADATVRITGAHTEVVAAGDDDHVLCSSSSGHDAIFDNRSTSIDPTCRKVHDRVLPVKDLGEHELATVAAQTITGDGTTGNPFVAPCSNPSAVDCTVDAFPRRYLKGLWANEYVPAYRCPSDHPYLIYRRYVPDGALVPPGVEIDEGGGPGGSPWPIGILISGFSTTRAPNGTVGTGTHSGFLNSSATNWSTGTAGYKVSLHCTSDPKHAWVTAL